MNHLVVRIARLPHREQLAGVQVIGLRDIHMDCGKGFGHEPEPLEPGFIADGSVNASTLKAFEQGLCRRQFIEGGNRDVLHNRPFWVSDSH